MKRDLGGRRFAKPKHPLEAHRKRREERKENFSQCIQLAANVHSRLVMQAMMKARSRMQEELRRNCLILPKREELSKKKKVGQHERERVIPYLSR